MEHVGTDEGSLQVRIPDGTFNYSCMLDVLLGRSGCGRPPAPSRCLLGGRGDFFHDELLTGIVERGPRGTAGPIAASECATANAALATGSHHHLDDAPLRRFIRRVFQEDSMPGSAALMAPTSGAGADAYVEEDVWLWDIAAAAAIARAGGAAVETHRLAGRGAGAGNRLAFASASGRR